MNLDRRQHALSGIIACLLIAGIFSAAPGQTTSDSLDVRVTNIAIAGEISARGLTAAFPHPVLATIAVADSNGNPIFGLADTSRWLTPQDVANVGLPMTSIWKRVVEYHRDNRSFPPNPNIFDQIPAPLFTEFRQSTPFPTSTMLVMDVSGSMIEELPDAKAAARLFVDLLRPIDRAGVIQFSHTIEAFQQMTNDKQKLFAIIDSAKAEGTTGLYDALVYAVQATKLENSRRAIIVYTDGVDISSTFTPAAVIDSARFYSIPIFTIALGTSTNPDTLKRIAKETGGLFFQTQDAVEFQKIYQQIAALIQNFYMIAYSSPDPARNGTWRTLEVTVGDLQGRQGRNSGEYFVPGDTTLRPTDLAVTLTSFTDMTVFKNGNAIKAVQPGDRYTYRLRIKNLGSERAEGIRLNQILPPSVSFISATNLPFYIERDSLIWQIALLEAGATDSIVVTAQLAADVPPAVTQLISRLTLSARNDNNPANNTARDTTQVVFPQATFTDLAVSQFVKTDSFAVVGNDTMYFAKSGETILYRIVVKNIGTVVAQNIRVADFLPDSVRAQNFLPAPASANADSVIWTLPSLLSQTSASFTFSATVSSGMPVGTNLLINKAIGRANNEDPTKLADNTSIDTVYNVVKPPPPPPTFADLEVSQFVATDSFAVVGNDTMHFAKSGETILYRIVVNNSSSVAAQNIRVSDFLPDSVAAKNFLPAPASANADSVIWALPSLLSQTSASFTFSATVSSDMPVGTNLLINQAMARADNEDPTKLIDNTSIDTVYNDVKPPPPPPTFADLEVLQFVETDSFAVVGSDTAHFAKSGETIFYRLVVNNSSSVAAQNIRVTDFLPDSVRAQNFLPAPASANADSVTWTLPSLLSQTSASFTFSATVSSDMPVGTNLLINKVIGGANNEDPTRLADNTSIDTVYNVVEPPPPLTDLSFDLNSHTLSSVVENGRVVNTVRPGEPIDYKIFVRNLGPNSSDNIRVRQLLPDSVRFVGASQALTFASKDSVVWQLAQLNSGGADSITISVLFASEVPQSLTRLISRADLFAANDNTPANNSAADTIRVIVPSPLGPTDLAVALVSRTGLTFFENGRLVNATTPGRRYEYHLQVRNLGVERAENIRLRQLLPDSVRFIAASPAPAFANHDSLVWQLATLNAGRVDSISVTVQVAPNVPQNLERLISRLTLFAANDNSPSNNTAIDTVRVLVPPLPGTLPLIEANPPEVTVGDSVRVRVQVLGAINRWDLWIYFANGQIDSSFADAFIKATRLSPNVWYNVTPPFANTRLFTAAKEEQIRFEIRTRDVLGNFAAASDAVVVRSNNDLVLDRNVFEVDTQPPLGINFKLSSNRLARLEVYDLNGVHITKLVEAPFNAGWNTYNWNGLTETGRQVGSGVYIVALRSGEFTAWKKCIIVR